MTADGRYTSDDYFLAGVQGLEATGRAVAWAWKPIGAGICWATALGLAILISPFVAINLICGDKDETKTLTETYTEFFSAGCADACPGGDDPSADRP